MALLNPSDASKVVTNYEMSLLGWYNANGKGTESSYNAEAQNGVKYTTTKPTDGNQNAGVFQASGLSVMDGSYIVYHPYDADFAKAGYLAVDFKTKQSAESTTTSSTTTTVADAQTAMLASAGDNAFSYSQPTVIEKGGKVAADFATTNLSALVKIALSSFTASEKLEKVILLEDAANFDKASKGFLKSAHLNAEKIKTQSGADVLESPEYTSMVTFAFTDGTNQTPGLTLTGGNANIYMVTGPRTSTSKYSVLLINDENKASIWKSGVNFTAGNKSTINIKYDDSHKFETLIVTDGADLNTILNTQSTYDGKTINVLGDLVIEDPKEVKAKNVTIQAYGNNPESSVKFVAKSADKTLGVTAATDDEGLKFNIPVTFASVGTNKMIIDGPVSLDNLTNTGALEIIGTKATVKTLVNKGNIDLAIESVFATTGNVVNEGTINTAAATADPKNGATWNIGQNTTLTNKGEINNYFTINNFGTIDNTDGTYVQKLEGKFIGQNDIAADKRGNYVIEVKSNDQFTYANGTTCTTIRIVNVTIGGSSPNILKGLAIEKKIEMTGASAKLVLQDTKLNGGLFIVDDATAAVIEGTATAKLIQINAASEKGKTAPKLTINAGSIIKANAIVNNGTGSIKEGATGIPADVKTSSSTGTGVWDNYPQVVSSL